METVCFDIPFCRQTKSCLFLFPLHKCFPLWHVVFICWSKDSVNLLSYLLKPLCQSNVFMLGSGNFFECVTEGYDNYPFSISTVEMFIVLNVHHLCFALWKSLQRSSFDMHVRNGDTGLPKHRGLQLDVKVIGESLGRLKNLLTPFLFNICQ